MEAIGTALAKMHANSIVHGDLTTSNMMLRPLPGQSPNFELVSVPVLKLYRGITQPARSLLLLGSHRFRLVFHVNVARDTRSGSLRPGARVRFHASCVRSIICEGMTQERQ
jgi:hypothetical protein